MRFLQFARNLTLLCSLFWLPAGFAANLDVLWYTYAVDGSRYRAEIGGLAANALTYSDGSGLSWDLDFYDSNDPAPDFGRYDVLVVHSGEPFRTSLPGDPLQTPS